MKNSLFRQIQRMLSRRKWLLLLVLLPLLIPIPTVKPHYKLILKIKLNSPDSQQTTIEKLKWLAEQVEILEQENLLRDALGKARFSQDEINKNFFFFKNNLDVSLEDGDILNIKLVALEKDKLKAVAAELVDIYFSIANQKSQLLQKKNYESQKTQLEALSNELKEAKTNLETASLAFDSFKARKVTNDTQQLKQEIDELKAKLYKLQTIYTKEHPSIKDITMLISNKTQELNDKQLQLEQEHKKEISLSDDYQKKKELFDKTLERYNSLERVVISPEAQTIGAVIKGPEIIDIGVGKIKFLGLVSKLLLGIVVLCLAGFATERIDKTVWNENDIRHDLGIKTLGSIIKPQKNLSSKLLINYPKNSEYVRSFETVRSNIQFINLVTSLKAILYTSLLKEHDLLAGNLAISMSFIGGKVCLVNAGAKNKKYSSLLSASGNDTVIKNLKYLDVDDLNAFDKQKASDFIAGIKEKFDVIIIDAPSITDSVISATLASVADGVILGAKSKKTEREYLLRNYRILNEINARVLGVVLQW